MVNILLIVLVFCTGLSGGAIIGMLMSDKISREYILGMNDTLKDYFTAINKIQEDYFHDILGKQNEYITSFTKDIVVAINDLNKVYEIPMWKDVKEELPICDGIYYGKRDDTNSMWKVIYKNGKWFLSGCPDTELDVIKWTELY